MKNRNLVFSLALSVSLMLPAIANSVNRSTAGPDCMDRNYRQTEFPCRHRLSRNHLPAL
jgi:hypothetical protein